MFIALVKNPSGKVLPLQIMANTIEQAEETAKNTLPKGWKLISVR